MLRNRHDTWKLFCEQHRELLPGTGLPPSLTDSETRFQDLLDLGEVVVSGNRFTIVELTPSAWSALYRFAALFFREFESYAPEDRFLGFRREVERRGDEFPR